MGRPIDAQMPEIIETGGDGTVALIQSHVQVGTQAGDLSSFYGRYCTARQRRQPLLRFRPRAGQEFTFRPVQVQREGELALPLPRVFRQKRGAGDEIGESRSVSSRRLCALTRDQVKLSQLLTLIAFTDQRSTTVEMIDDLENRLIPLIGGRLGQEQSP